MSFGPINQIRDTATRQLVLTLFQQITALQTQVQTLQAQALLRATPGEPERIEDIADPRQGNDAVNLQFLRRYVRAQINGAALIAPVTGGGAGGGPSGGGGIPGEPNVVPGDALPLPNELATVQAVFAANPGFVATSCQTSPGGTWDLMDAIVDALRAGDTRWGYNGKRGNASDPSLDALAYDYGAVAGGEGSTNVYVVDVIAGHCGASPSAAFQDVTIFAPGVWIGRGRF